MDIVYLLRIIAHREFIYGYVSRCNDKFEEALTMLIKLTGDDSKEVY